MITIEKMLTELAQFGVGLSPGVTLSAVLDKLRGDGRLRGEDPRARIEKDGYEWLLIALGEELYERKPVRKLTPISEGVWHFDAECIEDPDAYVVIARRAELISGGDLVFDDVRGNVDFDQNEAWLELTWRGRPERFELRIEHDWVDPRVFEHLERYLSATGTKRRFAMHQIGQSGLIVCQTPEAVSRLNGVIGLRFKTALSGQI